MSVAGELMGANASLITMKNPDVVALDLDVYRSGRLRVARARPDCTGPDAATAPSPPERSAAANAPLPTIPS